MKILAIDSSSTPASVAVTENETLLGEFTINIKRTHSEKLLPLIDLLLDTINIAASDIDAFAISAGPGSFTGLRIGMSVAKLMAQVSKKPLIAVSTLESLAMNVNTFNGYICPMIDARNNTVYSALYLCENGILTETEKPDAISVADLAQKLKTTDKKVLICGEYEKYVDSFANTAKASEHLTYQRAASCAVVAYRMIQNGVNTTPEEIVPLYIRESQAEQSKRAALKK